ncbi:nitrogen-fixing NifU domain protein [Thermocrinis albus DSM 14484]|uniref:Nitrogen-fixing NifU domain protein n=1 Tax=Thermocrinis albus (strain DSM 14484 / JCM 11386 / HI 11/12) TaxID=638303 RepID=D3SMQ3_THEAH|nr:NifU family protein [Thermocrinis albus]ADC90033.1 nitrogen-fixing NifU domain protein [Thermocrinis albus DSM 14484]
MENTWTEFEDTAKKIDELLEKVKNFPDEEREVVGLLVENLQKLTALGLRKLIRVLKEDSVGKELLLKAVREPEVYALFLKHGLVREDTHTKVARAIAMVKPYIQSHGGDVELVDVKDDTVIVSLKGACVGCAQSVFTLRQTILEAIQAYVPTIKRIVEVHSAGGGEGNYVRAFPLADLQEGSIRRFSHGDTDVVVVSFNGVIRAYRNSCAHQGLPLHDGQVTPDGRLVCPWHGFEYVVESGECLTAKYIQLESVPIKVEDGYVWILVH